ncbi:uncharacterized protein LOC107608997 [Arachis ipaensis]|uniref:uncharacterized protein LOC107608997 n=1 Tax=Arachis ipaensis TaxID=130454 RepID=UPI0007AF6BA7|nr:uncharacterized protein LOC107608997 [Arachis ipaensis]
MPLYAKFLKELINKKRSWNKKETVILTQECSAVIQRGLPPKLKDPGGFILSCTIGNRKLDKALCYLGASINLMPLSLMKKLAIEEVKPNRMSLQMADRSLKIPNWVVENLLAKIGEFIFLADFVILEGHSLIILGRPFLATARAIIDVEKGEMTLRVHDEKMIINVFKAMQYPLEKEKHMRVETIDEVEEELLEDDNQEEQEVKIEVEQDFIGEEVVEFSLKCKADEKIKQELKPLPPYLKYLFLGEAEALSVIINSSLNIEEETNLIEVLKAHKTALGWTIDDIKGISPAIYLVSAAGVSYRAGDTKAMIPRDDQIVPNGKYIRPPVVTASRPAEPAKDIPTPSTSQSPSTNQLLHQIIERLDRLDRKGK